MTELRETFLQELQKIRADNLYRSPRVLSGVRDAHITIDGTEYINFSSNNYLALATHPEVKKEAASAIETYGCGGTSSRLVAGTLTLHRILEDKLARLKQAESCLVFPSGFQANIGIITALAGSGDCLLMDELNHASLWDAAKLSRARIFVYPHRDMAALEKLCVRSQKYRRRMIVTDSIFSMDGDLAPLEDIVRLAKRYGLWTMLDEAHATGVFGRRGSGLAEHYGVEGQVEIRMGTLSKALGSQGGFVCGSRELIEYLINKSRPFIYTTALAPSCVAAARAALDIIERDPGRRKGLLTQAATLREKLTAEGFDTLSSESQIIPVLTGSVAETLLLSEKLLSAGIFAPAIRPPTVPDNKCRLRISLTSGHTAKDIEVLIRELKRIKYNA